MKLTDDDRAELLEELFPSKSMRPVRAEEVFRWIENERLARRRRLRYAATAAVVLLIAAYAVALFPRSRGPLLAGNTSGSGVEPEIPVVRPEASSSIVERVDDETLLRILDDTPAALVAWPDGRRSLLVVVQQSQQ